MSRRRHPRHRLAAAAAASVATIAALVLGLVAAPAAQAAESSLPVTTVVQTGKIGLADGRFDLTSVGGSEAGTVSVAEGASTQVSTVSAIGRAQVITYRIVLQGTPTDYWMRGTVDVTSDEFGEVLYADYDCTIFQGDPDAGGTAPDSDVPYSCDTSATGDGGGGGETVTFLVRDNIQAEVIGVIKPVGTVSMDSGYYDLSTVHAVSGSATIAPPYTAEFDAILRPGDVTSTPSTARGVFAYRIVDGGVPTSFWVVGIAENTDSTEYEHTSTCEIYNGDPTASLGSGDPGPVASVSPYLCDMSGADIGGRGSWQVTFTVSARELHVVTGSYDQANLINRLCTTTMDNCGVDRATTTTTWSDPVEASNRINNGTGSDTVEELTASHTSTVTTTVGVSLSVEAGIGEVFKATATASLSVAIGTSNTYTQKEVLTVAPHTSGWWAMQVQLVHAVGDVIVRDGDTYYLLPNITADFPIVNGKSSLTAMSVPYDGPTGSEEPPATGGGATPPATQPASPAAPITDPAAAHASGLADTGSTTDATPALAALAVLLIGLALVVSRRVVFRRRTARR